MRFAVAFHTRARLRALGKLVRQRNYFLIASPYPQRNVTPRPPIVVQAGVYVVDGWVQTPQEQSDGGALVIMGDSTGLFHELLTHEHTLWGLCGCG